MPSLSPSPHEDGFGEAEASSLARRYRSAQDIVLEYAIGLAILGLLPTLLTPILVIAAVLLIKMLWDIAQIWQFSFSSNAMAIGGWLMNGLGACAFSILAWMALIFLGAFLPLIDHYAISAGLMGGGWTLGAGTNQFFLNGFLHRLHRQQGERSHG